MEATKDYISLYTAKLLKDCEVGSKYKFFIGEWTSNKDVFNNEIKNNTGVVNTYKDQHKYWHQDFILPAYTRQEILWEYPEKFFGDLRNEEADCERCSGKYVGFIDGDGGEEFTDGDHLGERNIYTIAKEIIYYLQEEQYQEADEYFRRHCILIK